MRSSWSALLITAVLAAGLVLAAPPSAGDESQEAVWVPTMPVRPGTFDYLDLFWDGTGYALSSSDGVLFGSTDYGLTWTPKTTPESAWATAFGTPARGYALGFGVQRTDDGAGSWLKVAEPTTEGRASLLDALDAFGRRTAIVGGTSFSPDDDPGCSVPEDEDVTFWVTRNAGRSWKTTPLPFFGFVTDIDLLDNRHGVAIIYDKWVPERDELGECWLVSEANGIYVTTDGARSFRKVMACTNDRYCTAATMASKRRIVVGTNDAYVLVSEDGGKTFKQTQRLFNPAYQASEDTRAFWVGALGFANPAIGYASTKGGGTYRSADGGHSWEQEPSTELVWGAGVGDIAVGDAQHAIAGGPNFIITRVSDGSALGANLLDASRVAGAGEVDGERARALHPTVSGGVLLPLN